MTPQTSEILALKALGWIIAQDDLRATFMGSSGVAQEDIEARAGDPEFLVSVLDFLCMEDDWVTGFCDAHGYGYADPLAARQALPGGAQVHWT